MKKVLYAASTYGHILSFHIPYIKELEAMGFEVHIAAAGAIDTTGWPEGRKPRNAGALEHLQMIDIPFEKKMFSAKNFACVIQLMKLLQREHYNIISVHTTLAAFYLRLAVLLTKDIHPYVINTVHGYLFDKKSGDLKKGLMLLAEKLTKRVTDVVIVMNEQDYDIAKKHRLCKYELRKIPGLGINGEKYSRLVVEQRLRNDYDNEVTNLTTSDFHRWCREYIDVSSTDIVMIYAAEFSKRKNQRMLIEAMNHLPVNFTLILAGDGDQLKECMRLTKRNSKIKFVGNIGNLDRYYFCADICVSASRSEGLPFNIMEGMAMGLPIIATDVKGHQDLIQEGVNGFLYPYDDINAFVELAMRVAYNREIDPEVNIEKAKRYTMGNVFDEVMEVYRDFLK